MCFVFFHKCCQCTKMLRCGGGKEGSMTSGQSPQMLSLYQNVRGVEEEINVIVMYLGTIGIFLLA